MRELLRASVYKRSQGRITRQVTFFAVMVTLGGLWRLGTVIEPSVDPIVTAKPARVVCTLPGGRLESNGHIRLAGNDGAAEAAVHKGDDLADIADVVNRVRTATGVVAEIPATVDSKGKTRPDKTLVLASEKTGAVNFVRVELPESLQTVGGSHEAEEHGTDKLNLSLHFLIPAVLFFASMWVCYRLVNVPAFADFLIAVEAEMNKVSWPTRPELFRAAAVVLLVIFLMGAYLSVCDLVWGGLARLVLLRDPDVTDDLNLADQQRAAETAPDGPHGPPSPPLGSLPPIAAGGRASVR